MSAKYPPRWADGPSDAMCGCGARAVIVHDGWGRGDVLACSASGFSCEVCPAGPSPAVLPQPETETQR